MTSDNIFIAERLRNRLLDKCFRRGFDLKKGFEKPFTDQETRACKTTLKLIKSAHFKFADRILKNIVPDVWQAVFK